MTRLSQMLALLAGTALAAPALAQSPDTAATTSARTDDNREKPLQATPPPPADLPDPDAPPAPPPTAAEMQAQTAFLQAQIEAMQAQIESMKKQLGQATPSFKGAPQWANSEGFSFKPRGFMQFDAGYVSLPGKGLSGTVGGLNYDNLGWDTRARRLVFGAEGTLPGGFGYKVEFNFAQATVGYEDVVLTYQHPGSPMQVTIGNFFPLSGLDSMTSSRLGSFLERTSAVDAFNFNRRLGIAIGYAPKSDLYNITAGIFSQEIDNTNFQRTGWQASVRGVYSPTVGPARLHLGANYQHRTAPRDGQNVQYRARPFTQLTDQRFIDTGLIAADGDDIAGVEFAAIMKRIHVTGEAQKVWVRGYRPGRTFGPNNGVGGAAFYSSDPSFLNVYGEAGYFFTGETRGYKAGKWERTKVLHPITDGGIGAIQLNGRVEYTDLTDKTGDGPALAAPNYINGGRQLGYQASLIWNPIDYIRFLAQYAHIRYDGGPRAATIDPNGPALLLDRHYNVDEFGLRAQVEF
ncbi:porin [Sphingomonas profundi]|uniref:porin n=1 Tax=Alterirhizorhabdus profundi TaxID=2681549 RepID=UPI0012E92C44|nr:porin [Sphingomonas profundi]